MKEVLFLVTMQLIPALWKIGFILHSFIPVSMWIYLLSIVTKLYLKLFVKTSRLAGRLSEVNAIKCTIWVTCALKTAMKGSANSNTLVRANRVMERTPPSNL